VVASASRARQAAATCARRWASSASPEAEAVGEKIVVHHRWVHPTGDIPLDQAALIEPLAVGHRHGDVIVTISIWSHPATIDMQELVLQEIDLRGTIAYVRDHPETIMLVREGKVDLAPLITDRIDLQNLVHDGLEAPIEHKDTVKVLVDPS
jgi:threonine dehydrogenase-like Zn-dependent dehydrogenase